MVEAYPLITATRIKVESGGKPFARAHVGTIPRPAIRMNWFTASEIQKVSLRHQLGIRRMY